MLANTRAGIVVPHMDNANIRCYLVRQPLCVITVFGRLLFILGLTRKREEKNSGRNGGRPLMIIRPSGMFNWCGFRLKIGLFFGLK
jgi:hypothetical protein